MNILFISSGNNKFSISPIVFNQGESIKRENIAIDYLTINGRGIKGYLTNIPRIRKHLKKNEYNLIHAHYAFSAIAATLAFSKIPIIVSLMGSDSMLNLFWQSIVKLCNALIWSHVIVKSEEMKYRLKLKNVTVIPNGVDLNKFTEISKTNARNTLGLATNKKYILFLSNPERFEKNYKLAETAVKSLQNESIELIPIYNREYKEVVNYLNAVDLLLITSYWEGSPNAVKEAMACNLPVVSTNVGDVEWLFANEDGYYLTSFETNDVVVKIKTALEFSEKNKHTNGRKRIMEIGLDSNSIAKRIRNLYMEVLDKTE